MLLIFINNLELACSTVAIQTRFIVILESLFASF